MTAYSFETTREYRQWRDEFFASNQREPNDLDKVVFCHSMVQPNKGLPAVILSFLAGFGTYWFLFVR